MGRGVSDRDRTMHAETIALEQAGSAAAGATVFVTLEPCAHQGTTPPCAKALVNAKVAKVICATEDPNPLVAGKGFDILRAAGIVVETGLLEAEARWDLAGFLNVQTRSRPFLTLKLASALDGRIATATGDSKWITGPLARRKVHAMRASHDAVMVGAGTARADDPRLDVRGIGARTQPVRIVVSRRLDVPLDSTLAKTAKNQPVWLCHGPEAETAPWQKLGADCVPCEIHDGQVDLSSVMTQLAGRGLTRVFCEGGGGLAASLLTQGLVDDLVVFSAGVVVGAEGIPALSGMGIAALGDAPRFELASSQVVGGDVMQHWRPV